MFCMLLRKHIAGARIKSVSQPRLERAVDISLECVDVLGEPGEKHLIAEVMGRHSNLILTDSDGRIVDCLRRVDTTMSEKRQVLPGLFYRLPPPQDKRDRSRSRGRTFCVGFGTRRETGRPRSGSSIRSAHCRRLWPGSWPRGPAGRRISGSPRCSGETAASPCATRFFADRRYPGGSI